MKKAVSIHCTLALLAADCCAMAAIFTVFSTVEGMKNTDPCLGLWLLCLSLCHIGLGLFLRRERSERSVIYFCAPFFAVQLVLSFVIYGFFSSFMGVLISVCMWLYSYFSCYDLNRKKPTAERFTKSFDLCSLVLVFTLFFCSVKDISLVKVIPLALSTVLCLLALVAVRGGETGKLKGVLLSGGIVLCLGGFSAAFIALASGGLQKLLGWFVGGVRAALAFVYRCINALFLFLASLWPEKSYESMTAPELPSLETVGEPDQSYELFDPQILIISVLCIGLAVAAVLIIRRVVKGRKSFGEVYLGGEKNIQRRRSSLGGALVKAMRRLMGKLRFKLRSITARNAAPGLFVQIESRSRAKLHGRAESESCREFLLRAEEIYPWAKDELEKLAEAMDNLCFGGGSGLSPAEINSIRRSIFSHQEENTEI